MFYSPEKRRLPAGLDNMLNRYRAWRFRNKNPKDNATDTDIQHAFDQDSGQG